METKTKVFEVVEIVERVEEKSKERIIFELKEVSGKKKEWIYHTPNAQDHTEEQLKRILEKLNDLNMELMQNEASTELSSDSLKSDGYNIKSETSKV